MDSASSGRVMAMVVGDGLMKEELCCDIFVVVAVVIAIVCFCICCCNCGGVKNESEIERAKGERHLFLTIS